jgi:hypothetical protein
MNYGQAFTSAKGGLSVARTSWNTGAYITYENSNVELQTPPKMLYHYGINTISYVASDDDKQAEDWNVVG